MQLGQMPFWAAFVLALATTGCGSTTDAMGERSSSQSQPITGGNDLGPSQQIGWGWMGFLSQGGQPSCSAFAICPNAAITAAHCVTPPAPDTLQFVGAQYGSVTPTCTKNPQWGILGRPDYFNDIAVCTWSNPLPAGPKATLFSNAPPCPVASEIAGNGSGKYQFGTATFTGFDPIYLTPTLTPNPANGQPGDSGGPIFEGSGGVWATIAGGDGSAIYGPLLGTWQNWITSQLPAGCTLTWDQFANSCPQGP
jgi:hypothetical protein